MLKVLVILIVIIMVKTALDILGWYILNKYCKHEGYFTDGIYIYDNKCQLCYTNNAIINLLSRIKRFEYETGRRLTMKALVKVYSLKRS